MFILLIIIFIFSIVNLFFKNFLWLFSLVYILVFICIVFILVKNKSWFKGYISDITRITKFSQYLYIQGVYEKNKGFFSRVNIKYRRKKSFVDVKIKNNLVKHTSLFLDLDVFFIDNFYCDLVKKEINQKYIFYRLFLNENNIRLKMKDAKITNTSIEILKDVHWQFAKYPHALVCGGTGSGKTYFLEFLIYNFKKIGAEVYIADPKQTDLSYLDYTKEYEDYVACEIEDIISLTKYFFDKMQERVTEFSSLTKGVAGYNYYDFDLKPYVLVLDELSAFSKSLDYKEEKDFYKYLSQIILKGRQLGFFVVVGMQRADSQFLPDGLRDQFSLRVALGKMSPSGYSMIFGDSTRKYSDVDVVGFGYYMLNSLLIKEFYSPFIDNDFNFIDEMCKL